MIEYPEAGAPPALRFTAGIRSLDLRPWPRDWADAPNERLVEMLRRRDDKPADVSAGAR